MSHRHPNRRAGNRACAGIALVSLAIASSSCSVYDPRLSAASSTSSSLPSASSSPLGTVTSDSVSSSHQSLGTASSEQDAPKEDDPNQESGSTLDSSASPAESSVPSTTRTTQDDSSADSSTSTSSFSGPSSSATTSTTDSSTGVPKSSLCPIERIVDPLLREAVLERIGANKGDFAELQTLEVVHHRLSGKIKSLAGLECARKLKSLKLENQMIEELGPLRGLTQLHTLALQDNPVGSGELVEVLGGHLSQLAELSLSLDKRDSDHGWLGKLTGLRSIRLSGEGVSEAVLEILLKHKDIETVELPSVGSFDDRALDRYCGSGAAAMKSRCSKLEKLKLSFATIHDLKWLPESSRLRRLDLSNNLIRDLTPLPRAKNLSHLVLHRNLIASLEPIRELKALENLQVNENSRLEELSVVADLPRLLTFYASGASIKNLTPLKRSKSLRDIRLGRNDISSVHALSHIKTLVVIDIGYNKVKNIDSLRKLSQLQVLLMAGNRGITSTAPLADMLRLRNLNAQRCGLKDVEGLAKLVREGVLRTISLSGNPKELCEHTTMKKLLALKNEADFASSLLLESDCD